MTKEAGIEAPKKEELKQSCICNNINISQISYNEKLGIYSCATCTHSWSEPKELLDKDEDALGIEVEEKDKTGESLHDYLTRNKLTSSRREMLERIKEMTIISHEIIY